jgi:hypothetical protein
MRILFGILFLLVAFASQTVAGTICPTVSPNPGIADPTGCNFVVTVTAVDGGGVATAFNIVMKDAHPYEFADDQLVGVINNATAALTQVALSGPGIWGFDGDGICAGGYIPASYCTTHDSTGYGPSGVSFSNIVGNGLVNFSPGVAAGATGFFSLEGSPGANPVGPATPEPGNLGALAAGLAAIAYWARKRLAR